MLKAKTWQKIQKNWRSEHINLLLFSPQKSLKWKLEDFCFVLYINLQDKENRRLNGNILEDVQDVPGTVRSQEIVAVHDATSF